MKKIIAWATKITTMPIDEEFEARRLLNEYKWGENFICSKCGNTTFKPRKNFGRQCKKCPNEETGFGNTALVGCKIPPDKILSIITYLIDSVHIDFDKKAIAVKLDTNGKIFHENNPVKDDSIVSHMEGIDADEGIIISLNELREKQLEGDVSPETERVLFENYITESRLIQSEVATKFNVNPNSLHLLFEKIAKRISFFHEDDWGIETLEIINSFFGDGRHDLNYVLGMLMARVDDTWIKNEKNVDGKWYHIVRPLRMETDKMRWEIRNFIFVRKNAEGNLKHYYNKENEPEFLAEE